MSFYRRLSVEVEARGPLTYANGQELVEWIRGDNGYFAEFFPDPAGPEGTWGSFLNIRAEEGIVKVEEGDMIVKDGDSFYPIKLDLFEVGFEEIS